MAKATSESKTIVAAAVPPALARALKNAAAREDRTVSAEIRRALARHLDDRPEDRELVEQGR